ncbi:hypothetical protein [Nocardia jinanensis]|uniref:Uncharacterized protein n=1 Tax=Nocardia jinanensis TaxID=382504 RepID=A0A917VXF9_9NOCA|nr:hypothetical protein [Nocardia jinanensis]GGL40509.1 hypothetical protein GCM10011588_64060 [Nocardia jinanensis]
MVEFRDVMGFAADVGVSMAAEHFMKGGSGGVWRGIGVGAAAGGLGGAAGAWVTDGFSIDGLGKGAISGALGGAAGAGLGRWWSSSMTKGKTAADEALAEADAVKKSTDADGRLIDDAEAGLEVAETKLDEAQQALQRVNAEVATQQARVDDLSRQLQADPNNGFLQQELSHARGRLDDAETRARAAQDNVDVAEREADVAIEKYNDADADWVGVEDAARNADEGFKKAEDAAKAAGKKLENFNKYYRGTLVGLGSAGFMLLGVHGLPFSSDGSGGDGAQKSALMWDGYKPAAAAGVMGQPPFEQGSSPVKGQGFLLRPVDLVNPSIVEWYGGASNSLAYSLVDTYQMFGDLKKTEDLAITNIPKMPASVKGVDGSAGGASYTDAAKSLDKSATMLNETQANVASALKIVKEVSKAGKENVGSLVVGVNRYIVERLQNNSDIEFITVVGQAFAELVNELETAAAKNNNAAAGINQPTAADQAAAQNLANSVNGYAGQLNNPGLNPDSSQIGANNPWDPGNLGTGAGSTPSTADLKDSADRLRDQANDMVGSANTPSDINPASYNPASYNPGAYSPGASPLGSTDPMGGMSGLMSSMLPMMMQQAAMRDMADTDMSGRMDDIDPSRFDQAAVPTLPQAQQPVGTTPWSNQAAANNAAATPAQPAHQPTNTPNGATSTQPGTAVPKRVPGDDGLVPYAFPDGRTQRVPVAVAQALDKAFANKNGTDAQAAYQGTAGAWADSKDIGPGVDPFQLATGDVGTWIIRQPKADQQKPEPVPARADSAPEIQPAAMVTVGGATGENEEPPKDKPDTGSSDESNFRTALLVAFGEGESGTLEVVVNGELRQYETEMSDTEGDFGEFAGFKHPKGVESGGDKGQDSEAMATSGDQTTADVPALAMPV